LPVGGPDPDRARFSRRQVVTVGAAALSVAITGTAPRWAGPARPHPETSDSAASLDSAQIRWLRRYFMRRGELAVEHLGPHEDAPDADQIMKHGWTDGPYPAVALDLPIDWVRLCATNRSWNFSFHSWRWMRPVVLAYERTGERRYLNWCVTRVVSWARTFNRGGGRGTMAWSDMAIGLRGFLLGYIVEQAVLNRIDVGVIRVLLTCVARHQREFTAQRTFNPYTNHGFYVAAGQLAFSRRLAPVPGMVSLAAQARVRMRDIARRQWMPDGGHPEHSPGYHGLLLASFRKVADAGLLDDPEVGRRLALAEEALGWFVQPDGYLSYVGDTSANEIAASGIRTTSPTTNFLLTRGRRGRPNPEQLKVLPHTGYAIVRSPQPTGTDDHRRSGYLLLQAGYHSYTHKHADDLSITWFDRRREILVDAGRYGYAHTTLPKDHPLRRRGYFYSAPERQYVESTPAHNTVAVDHMDHDRVTREPYGSAIAEAEEREGHFRIEAVVNHGIWRHRRDVVYRPGRWLQVTDIVTALDGRAHDFRVWWNFPAELVPRAVGAGRLAIALPHSADTLWVTELEASRTIAPVTAQRGPLRGWRSRVALELTPAWSTGFEVRAVRRHTFRTLFHFGDPPGGAPRHPFG
jgi:hypothetical protein